ncbi:MAG: hypothetical protein VX656_01350, partial [Candidatus Latescibacterota bacterium]|nr:hypothetical protein [Candidatus Latescibacterota bacterium]
MGKWLAAQHMPRCREPHEPDLDTSSPTRPSSSPRPATRSDEERMTQIRVYDTPRRQKVDFEPLEPGKVRMYSCGPTVWDYAHIGNFRAFLFPDVLKRY